mmetsp:Transcript_8338/g.23712  ORF Transcript_8338/g.23712 Transcript_8338/m.23712 type:complete len:132 (+) Transcript_8338:301-696(+)
MSPAASLRLKTVTVRLLRMTLREADVTVMACLESALPFRAAAADDTHGGGGGGDPCSPFRFLSVWELMAMTLREVARDGGDGGDIDKTNLGLEIVWFASEVVLRQPDQLSLIAYTSSRTTHTKHRHRHQHH